MFLCFLTEKHYKKTNVRLWLHMQVFLLTLKAENIKNRKVGPGPLFKRIGTASSTLALSVAYSTRPRFLLIMRAIITGHA